MLHLPETCFTNTEALRAIKKEEHHVRSQRTPYTQDVN